VNNLPNKRLESDTQPRGKNTVALPQALGRVVECRSTAAGHQQPLALQAYQPVYCPLQHHRVAFPEGRRISMSEVNRVWRLRVDWPARVMMAGVAKDC